MTAPARSRRRFVGTALTALVAAPAVLRGAAKAGFAIGLVADAQYADVEAKGTRFYRESVGKLGEAVEHFNRRDLAFCVHLGDLIDREWKSYATMDRVLQSSRHRWHQVLGNHDFEVLDSEKAGVVSRLGMPWRHGAFVHAGFRFVILDTNDVSTYAHAAATPERAAAERELQGLQAIGRRQAKSWNGGVGPAQLAWLERECLAAAAAQQRVIILAHHPVYPDNDHNLWNAGQVLALLERQRSVVAWLNGHNHAGALGESHGVPFVTLHGMVETRATSAFATATVLADRLVLAGHGREPSRELLFRSA